MKKKILPNCWIWMMCIIVIASSCKKEDDFLNAKPNQALTVPTTLQDYQDLLNTENNFTYGIQCSLGDIAGEEFTVSDNFLDQMTPTERNAYVFAKDIYQNDFDYSGWSTSYSAVYKANVVLDGIAKLKIAAPQQELYNLVKGSALFYRSYFLYCLTQTFSLPYDPVNSKTDLGIPLRTSSDFNIKVERATVQQCYDLILKDLKDCLSLLPATSNYKTRPSKLTTNALLARIYLAIGDYTNAFTYVNESLQLNSALDDYNTLTKTPYSISKEFLSEDVFHVMTRSFYLMYWSNANMNADLLSLYQPDDLRRTLYFTDVGAVIGFTGTYDYYGDTYSGLANDEMFLIRAECYARRGDVAMAMKDLNTLLLKRWKAGAFVDITAGSADEAMDKILLERRKELIYRGLRWTDLRRLNKEDRFKTTLTRVVNGTVNTLPPNDPRYAMPIPVDEIRLTGIPQNNR